MALSLLFGASTSMYRLVDDDRQVGTLAGDALVFTGFRSLADAERAGDAGYIALLAWLAEREERAADPHTMLHVAVNEDELSEWIGPNGRVLARIVRPGANERFEVEFTLPPHVPTAAAAGAASRIYDAIQRAAQGAPPMAYHS